VAQIAAQNAAAGMVERRASSSTSWRLGTRGASVSPDPHRIVTSLAFRARSTILGFSPKTLVGLGNRVEIMSA
jgi:hypothetical protein